MTQQSEKVSGILHCSFCGASQEKAECIVAGPSVQICADCIEVCMSVVLDRRIMARTKVNHLDIPKPTKVMDA